MTKWRLVLSGSENPFVNMAVDEAILKNYKADKIPTIRFYSWDPAGMSVGCFQPVEKILNVNFLKKSGIPIVRRMTGGESIFHDNDLSYSIVCSARDMDFPRSVKDSYFVLIEFIVNFYKEMSLAPEYFDHIARGSDFCFANKNIFDIKIKGKKLGGNAQKRSKDIIFQHGSIPIKIDRKKIMKIFKENLGRLNEDTISLSEALGKDVNFDNLADMLKGSFIKTYGAELVSGKLSKEEENLKDVLMEEKYENDEWNFKK